MGDDGHWRPPICSAVWNVGTPSPRPYWPDTTELALLDVQSIVLRGHPLHAANASVTLLNDMVQYMTTGLNTSFAALSDGTRRGVLEQLGRGDASVMEVAERFQLTLTDMKKHVGVLE